MNWSEHKTKQTKHEHNKTTYELSRMLAYSYSIFLSHSHCVIREITVHNRTIHNRTIHNRTIHNSTIHNI